MKVGLSTPGSYAKYSGFTIKTHFFLKQINKQKKKVYTSIYRVLWFAFIGSGIMKERELTLATHSLLYEVINSEDKQCAVA